MLENLTDWATSIVERLGCLGVAMLVAQIGRPDRRTHARTADALWRRRLPTTLPPSTASSS
jgi:hypothetical protein